MRIFLSLLTIIIVIILGMVSTSSCSNGEKNDRNEPIEKFEESEPVLKPQEKKPISEKKEPLIEIDIVAKLLGHSCEDFPLPKDSIWPKLKEDESTVDKRVFLEDCSDFKEKFGQLDAILITLANRGGKTLEVPIETLNSVVLNSKGGKKQSPIGMYWRTYFKFLKDYAYFVTPKVDGTLTLVLQPEEKTYLVFFFPSASSGETIQIGKIAPAKVAYQ